MKPLKKFDLAGRRGKTRGLDLLSCVVFTNVRDTRPASHIPSYVLLCNIFGSTINFVIDSTPTLSRDSLQENY